MFSLSQHIILIENRSKMRVNAYTRVSIRSIISAGISVILKKVEKCFSNNNLNCNTSKHILI